MGGVINGWVGVSTFSRLGFKFLYYFLKKNNVKSVYQNPILG